MNRAQNADHAAGVCKQFLYRLYDYQTWKIQFLEKFMRCAKVCGLFFLTVLFGCWLAEQVNSNHTEGNRAKPVPCANPFVRVGWGEVRWGTPQYTLFLWQKVNVLSGLPRFPRRLGCSCQLSVGKFCAYADRTGTYIHSTPRNLFRKCGLHLMWRFL